jgi:type I restriction enzyme, S subunit
VKRNMESHWTDIPIGEILTYLEDQVAFDDMAEYITITVKRRHGGLEGRETLFGHEIKTKKQYRLHRGAFIISRVQCWHAAFAIVPDDIPENMIASQNYDQFEISPKVDKRFFWWLSHSPQFIETVRSSASGVVIEKMVFNRDAWLQKTVPLPSLTEQRRIVKRIEALASRVAEAQSLRWEADEETEFLLAAQLKNIRQKLLKSDYPKKKIGDIALVTSGGTPSRDNPTYWGGAIPWIKTGELIDGDVIETEEHITEEGMKNSSARLFPSETILVALYGQGQTRGRTARLMIEATTNQACCAILPTPDILESRFTQYWQRSLYYEMREKSHGGAQPNWNGSMIKNIEIALPPLEEQRRLVVYLDGLQAQVSALRTAQAETEKELSALMPSILDKAFKGEL